MTGREQKVYYSYSQISHKHSVPDDGLPPQAQPPPPPGKEARLISTCQTVDQHLSAAWSAPISGLISPCQPVDQQLSAS